MGNFVTWPRQFKTESSVDNMSKPRNKTAGNNKNYVKTIYISNYNMPSEEGLNDKNIAIKAGRKDGRVGRANQKIRFHSY